jgi:hypothetical protein
MPGRTPLTPPGAVTLRDVLERVAIPRQPDWPQREDAASFMGRINGSLAVSSLSSAHCSINSLFIRATLPHSHPTTGPVRITGPARNDRQPAKYRLHSGWLPGRLAMALQ